MSQDDYRSLPDFEPPMNKELVINMPGVAWACAFIAFMFMAGTFFGMGLNLRRIAKALDRMAPPEAEAKP